MARHAWLVCCFVIALGVAARPVAAAEPDAATRSSARELGEEGNKLFAAGDYAGALGKYQRAASLVNVPTLGLRIARCLEKLGRLVEASEQYLATERMPRADKELAVHEEARAQAQAERALLLPRIPSVVVTLEGEGDIQVEIDGKPLPGALVGAKRATDPGTHQVHATRGTERKTRDVSLKEGETVTVAFSFAGAAPAAALPRAAPRSSPERPKSAPSRPVEPSTTQRTLGLVGLALGGAGVALGVGAGLGAMSKKSKLESRCGSDLQCPPEAHSDADGYNRLRAFSTIGFVAGGVLGATGATLLLTAPRSEKRVTAFVAPLRVGVAGAF